MNRNLSKLICSKKIICFLNAKLIKLIKTLRNWTKPFKDYNKKIDQAKVSFFKWNKTLISLIDS